MANDSIGVTNDFHSSLHVKFDDVTIDTQVTSQSYLCSNGVASQAQIALNTSLFIDIFNNTDIEFEYLCIIEEIEYITVTRDEWHTLKSNP